MILRCTQSDLTESTMDNIIHTRVHASVCQREQRNVSIHRAPLFNSHVSGYIPYPNHQNTHDSTIPWP